MKRNCKSVIRLLTIVFLTTATLCHSYPTDSEFNILKSANLAQMKTNAGVEPAEVNQEGGEGESIDLLNSRRFGGRKKPKTKTFDGGAGTFSSAASLESIFDSFTQTSFRVEGLIIINNNNNNNNINEDLFTIDEILELMDKQHQEYLTYNDVLGYDQARRLSAMKERAANKTAELKKAAKEEEKEKETPLVHLLDNMDEVKQNETDTEDVVSLSSRISYGRPRKSKSGTAAKNLQFASVASTGPNGVIIINNKNTNNNEQVKAYGYGKEGEYGYQDQINIENSNNGVSLGLDKLSDTDIQNLLDNSIILNNDNSNENKNGPSHTPY